jgi:glycosyltransferase involved in cell wall biosynthesis
VRILVFPREDGNPYQRLLYAEMRKLGVRVAYVGCLTPSHTLNLLLLPLELAVRRLAGARLVHLHWVHKFAITGANSSGVLRRVSQAWFGVCLMTVRVLGLRLVWTAHNALPHARVFADDVGARRRLVAACDLVLAHSPAALDELAGLGAVPHRSAVVPHGPFAPTQLRMRVPGAGTGPRRLLFFGRVTAYKGIEDLVAAFAALPPGVRAQLTIAGECRDSGLRSSLLHAADVANGQLKVRLEWIPDAEISPLLADADAVVLPFRTVTTSGSAVLALCHGRPLVVPDLAAFAELPGQAVVRYDRTVGGLASALAQVAAADAADLASMSAAALSCTRDLAWPDIAVSTASAMSGLTGPSSARRRRAECWTPGAR